jgi:hypothetical protein
MDDGERRDCTGRRRRLAAGLGLDRLQLAGGSAVDDIPAAGAELLAYGIGGLEVASQTALDPLAQKLFSLGLIRAFWLSRRQ